MTTHHYASIAKGAGIAAGGALLTYLLGVVPNENFGTYTPIVTALMSIFINAALKWLDSKKTADVTIESLPDAHPMD